MSPADRARDAFLLGVSDRYTLGERSELVHAEVRRGRVRVRRTGTRRQRTLGPDTPDHRRTAVRVAEALHEHLAERSEAATGADVDGIRVRDVWLKYLHERVPDLPSGVLSWGRKSLAGHYAKLTPQARALAPSVDSSYIIIQAARRMNRSGAAPWDARMADLEPGHVNRHATRLANRGLSPHTASTDLGRWKSALRFCRKAFPKWWGDLGRPDEGLEPVPTAHIKPDEIGEGKAARLIDALHRSGSWRAWAAALIASESGRRIGAIGARRVGLHMDDAPLTADDFKEEAGALYVTWRAGPSKGGGYNRGDQTVPCTQAMAQMYRWIQAHQPNPMGPSHPLLWSPEDPRRAVSYEALTAALDGAWRRAFGEPRPRGVAWHALIRGMVTTITHLLDEISAAEYSGRSREVLVRKYKRIRDEHQREVVAALDGARGRAR